MGAMKPSFNFLELLPFQLLGMLGIASSLVGYKAGGLWLFVGIGLGLILCVAAIRSVSMR
jgi:hypothetical protein